MLRQAVKMDGPNRQQFMLTRTSSPRCAKSRANVSGSGFSTMSCERARLVDRQHGVAADAVRIDIALLDERRSAERRQARAVERDERAQHVDRVVVVGVEDEKRRAVRRTPSADSTASAVPRASCWTAKVTRTRSGGRVRS